MTEQVTEYPTGPSDDSEEIQTQDGQRGIIKKVAVVGAIGVLGVCAYQAVKKYRRRKNHHHRGIDEEDNKDEEYELVDEAGAVVEQPSTECEFANPQNQQDTSNPYYHQQNYVDPYYQQQNCVDPYYQQQNYYQQNYTGQY